MDSETVTGGGGVGSFGSDEDESPIGVVLGGTE